MDVVVEVVDGRGGDIEDVDVVDDDDDDEEEEEEAEGMVASSDQSVGSSTLGSMKEMRQLDVLLLSLSSLWIYFD